MHYALRPSPLFLILILAATVPLAAQPTAVVNVASFANPNLPNGNIAQGSMFTVFGSNLGPASLKIVDAFPLPTELGGTSIEVMVGGQTVNCIMIFSAAGQVAAVLPSATPTGAGMLTLTYNGQAGAPIPINVVANSFGTFGINQAGSGPGVLTNAVDPLSVNTVLNTAVAGDMWDIWGTGLGPVQGDEAAMPLQGDLPIDVQILVGNTEAQVVYRGRSGCCVGIDQVRFIVPAGVTGCYVPITVVVEGVASNFTTMAISQNGGACSDPATGVDAEILSRAQTNGSLKVGTVSGSRSRVDFALPLGGLGQSFTSTTDSIAADFEDITVQQIERISGLLDVSFNGGCFVYQFRESDGQDIEDPVETRSLDAGSLTLSGPEGMRPIPRDSSGFYFDLLTSPFSFARSLAAKDPGTKNQFPGGGEGYYQPGAHTVSGAGGPDVGAFTAEFEVGDELTWTNQTNSIARSAPFTVQWQGGSGDRVLIFGVSSFEFDEETGSGAAFWCSADRSAGSFTIPRAVLSSLPPTAAVEGVPAGIFAVGTQSLEPFTASGIDVGFSSFTDLTMQFGIDYP